MEATERGVSFMVGTRYHQALPSVSEQLEGKCRVSGVMVEGA
jgi:hypothetical protein